jgi:hypothetical protein
MSIQCAIKDQMKEIPLTQGQVARWQIHGQANKTSEYTAWLNIRERCHNPNHPSYHTYGAKGIKVCDRWFSSFENFYADMGSKRSAELTIERIDNSKGYEPVNCEWADRKVQSRNTSRNNMVTYKGSEMCLLDACQMANVNRTTIQSRMRKGMSFDAAVSLIDGRHDNRNQGNNTSGFVGVYWNEKNAKWSASIYANKKHHFLGSFTDKMSAVKARDEAAKSGLYSLKFDDSRI